MLRHLGRGRFQAYSAGSSPREHQQPHPLALATLSQAGIPTAGLSSKSWDVFARPDAPRMDLIVTVCDNAAGEVCPIWPGHPATAHWGFADPSAVDGEEARRQAFVETLGLIRLRIEALVALSDAELSPNQLQQAARRLALAS
jgi:protein-tyrosine-phosphatase